MNASVFASVARVVVTGAAVVYLLRQCRRPSGWVGQGYAHLMNRSHRALTRWGLDDLAIPPASAILDVGCGGGKTIQELARVVPDGTVTGVDYSAASVTVARRTNARAITAGQVKILQASVSQLPFEAGSFDIATAVETHYYWSDLIRDLGEIHRVLRRGGRVVLIAEAYRSDRHGAVESGAMRLLGGRVLTPAEHEAALRAAGFDAVTVKEDARRGWLSVVGEKSSHAA